MIIDLSGKTATVTGTTGDIGLAIATELADACARITIAGRGQGRIDAAVARIAVRTGKADAESIVANVGSPGDAKR